MTKMGTTKTACLIKNNGSIRMPQQHLRGSPIHTCFRSPAGGRAIDDRPPTWTAQERRYNPATGPLREGAVDRFLTKNRELLDALPPEVRAAVTPRNADDINARLSDIEQRARLSAS
jgi:hypothetical protein